VSINVSQQVYWRPLQICFETFGTAIDFAQYRSDQLMANGEPASRLLAGIRVRSVVTTGGSFLQNDCPHVLQATAPWLPLRTAGYCTLTVPAYCRLLHPDCPCVLQATAPWRSLRTAGYCTLTVPTYCRLLHP